MFVLLDVYIMYNINTRVIELYRFSFISHRCRISKLAASDKK